MTLLELQSTIGVPVLTLVIPGTTRTREPSSKCFDEKLSWMKVDFWRLKIEF